MSEQNQAGQQGDDYHQRPGGRQTQQGGQPQQKNQQGQQEQVWQHLQWGAIKRDRRKPDGSQGAGDHDSDQANGGH